MTDFRKQAVSDQLAEKVGLMIRERRMPAGSPLPSTRTLAKHFGVSRPTAQVALRELASQGVIELRSRHGAFVKASLPAADRDLSTGSVAIVWPAGADYRPTRYDSGWTERSLNAVDQELFKVHWHLTPLFYNRQAPDLESRVFSRLDQLRTGLRGVIWFARPEALPLKDELDKRGIPHVAIAAPQQGSVYNFVAGDYLDVGLRLGRCLIAMGVERILCLHVRNSSLVPLEKITGLYHAYLEAMRPTMGIETLHVEDESDSTGYEVTSRYLDSHSCRPQVIFGSGDFLAIGAIRACQDRGIRVPEEVGVLGGSGMELESSFRPALTAMIEPVKELGRQAARLLIERVKTGMPRAVGRRIPIPIHFRESLAVPDGLRNEAEKAYQKHLKDFEFSITAPAETASVI